jgi:hypothetical protein
LAQETLDSEPRPLEGVKNSDFPFAAGVDTDPCDFIRLFSSTLPVSTFDWLESLQRPVSQKSQKAM